MDKFDWACVSIITFSSIVGMFLKPTRYEWVVLCITVIVLTAHTVFLKLTARSGEVKP